MEFFQNEPTTSPPTLSMPYSDLGRVTIAGGGATTVTLNYGGGELLPGGLTLDSEGPSTTPDRLIVAGDPGASYTLSFTQLAITPEVAGSTFTDIVDFSSPTAFDLFGSGGTSPFEVSSGNFTFNSDLGADAAVDMTIDPTASVAFGVTQHLDSLTIDTGGAVSMVPAGGQVLDTNSLTVNGTLDLANNDLIVNTPGAAMDTLEEAVAAGVTGSATQGIIFSSTAATDWLSIGVAPESAVNLSTLDGVNVPSTAMIARYTAMGDANLDGVVNFEDLLALAQNYQQTVGLTPPMWDEADFNYDGTVNFNDLGLLAQRYNQTVITQPVDVTVGTAFTTTLPAVTPSGDSILRWDINWGDGTNDSYAAGVTSASHVYTQAGLAQVDFSAVTYDSTAGYGSYHDPAQALVIGDGGTTAAPVSVAATSSSDTFDITADGAGDTIITENGSVVVDEPTADILSLSITGAAAEVSVDFTNGDPLPMGGLYSDAASIQLDGPHGTDQLVTTSNAAYIGNDDIRCGLSTTLIDNLTSSGGILAIAGTVTVSDPAEAALAVDTGATVYLSGSQTLASLTVDAGGTVRLISDTTSSSPPVLAVVGAVKIESADGNGNNAGILDLGAGNITIAQGYGGSNFIIARFNPDGTVDTSFGVEGFVAGVVGSAGLQTVVSSDGDSIYVGTPGGDNWVALPTTIASGSGGAGPSVVLTGSQYDLYVSGALLAGTAGGLTGYLGAAGLEAGLTYVGIAASVPITIPVIIGIGVGYELYHYAIWGTWGF